MEPNKRLTVEVVYATPTQQKMIKLEVPIGSTIQEAIDESGILAIFPEIDLSRQKVGVFSHLKHLTDRLNDGDRVEIYRPLTIDPKEARRRRVVKKNK
jgi:putative ubiquitin-RnfH superfamily antitoxin RatB of RatAB toxin-antitoxin module